MCCHVVLLFRFLDSVSYNDIILGYIMMHVFFVFVFYFNFLIQFFSFFAPWVVTAYCCSIDAKEKPFWPHFNRAQAALLLC